MISLCIDSIDDEVFIVLPFSQNSRDDGGKHHLTNDYYKTLCGLVCHTFATTENNDNLRLFMNAPGNTVMDNYICLRCAKKLQTAVYYFPMDNDLDRLWDFEFNGYIGLESNKYSYVASNSLTNIKKEISSMGFYVVYLQCKNGSFSYGQDVVDQYPFMPRPKPKKWYRLKNDN